MTPLWDVFHSVKLEVERGIATELVRSRLLDGTLNGDDLIRAAGTTRWSRINQVAAFTALAEPPPAAAPLVIAPPPAPVVESPRLAPDPDPDPEPDPAPEPGPQPLAELEFPDEDEDEEEDEEFPAEEVDLAADAPEPAGSAPAGFRDDDRFDPPILPDDEAGGPRPPELGDPLAPELEAANDAEDDEASDFTLTRNSTETVEELDLAAMVDVAFQLVLFFLVTASTLVFKTLEVPRPNEDKPPEAAAQSRAKSIDELEKDYILVEVDTEGAVKVDHLPVPADRAALVEKLRTARESTGRKSMLLSADFGTRHKNAVLAFDVASEIDLQIAIAQPTGKN